MKAFIVGSPVTAFSFSVVKNFEEGFSKPVYQTNCMFDEIVKEINNFENSGNPIDEIVLLGNKDYMNQLKKLIQSNFSNIQVSIQL